MRDWNVVICLYQDDFRRALRSLRQFGAIERTRFHNVLVMKVDDPVALLEAVEKRTAEYPAFYDAVSRVAPAQDCFDFHSAEEFMGWAKLIVLNWLPHLAGRSFHVRFHRRGTPYDLPTPDTERALDDALLEAAYKAGTPCRIAFDDPDAVIAIDTIDERAGIGVWGREDLTRHRLLRPD